MSASPSLLPLSVSVIVTRLRAVGCVFAEDEARLLIATARTEKRDNEVAIYADALRRLRES